MKSEAMQRLAADCEHIWPVGWESNGHQDSATATVDGVALRCEKHSFLINGKSYVGYDKLRDQLQAMQRLTAATPRRVPDLVPDVAPVLLLFKAVLEPLGWAASSDCTQYQKKAESGGHWTIYVAMPGETIRLGHSNSDCAIGIVKGIPASNRVDVVAALQQLATCLPRFP